MSLAEARLPTSSATNRGAASPPARRGRGLRSVLVPYLFLAPFFVLFLAFLIAPLVFALYTSVFRDTLVGGHQFVAFGGLPLRPGDALLARQYGHLGIHRLQHGHLLRGAEGGPIGAPRSGRDRRRRPMAICMAGAVASALAGNPPHHHLLDQRHAAA